MSLEYAILGFLSERPRTGYDLKTRCFDDTLDGLWPADQAQIYRTLDRLSKAKFIASRRRRQAGKPDQRIYELTPEGRWALDAWLAEPTAPPAVRDPLHLQIYFGHRTPDASLAAVLRAARDQHQARLDSLRSHAGQLVAAPNEGERSGVLRQTAFDGAIALERATIDWLDDCIDAVEKGALPGSAEGIGQRQLFGS